MLPKTNVPVVWCSSPHTVLQVDCIWTISQPLQSGDEQTSPDEQPVSCTQTCLQRGKMRSGQSIRQHFSFSRSRVAPSGQLVPETLDWQSDTEKHWLLFTSCSWRVRNQVWFIKKIYWLSLFSRLVTINPQILVNVNVLNLSDISYRLGDP